MSVTSGMAGQFLSEAWRLEGSKLRRKTMMTAIKLGLVAFVLFAAYVVETRAILALESSDNWTQVYEYAP